MSPHTFEAGQPGGPFDIGNEVSSIGKKSYAILAERQNEWFEICANVHQRKKGFGILFYHEK